MSLAALYCISDCKRGAPLRGRLYRRVVFASLKGQKSGCPLTANRFPLPAGHSHSERKRRISVQDVTASFVDKYHSAGGCIPDKEKGVGAFGAQVQAFIGLPPWNVEVPPTERAGSEEVIKYGGRQQTGCIPDCKKRGAASRQVV